MDTRPHKNVGKEFKAPLKPETSGIRSFLVIYHGYIDDLLRCSAKTSEVKIEEKYELVTKINYCILFCKLVSSVIDRS